MAKAKSKSASAGVDRTALLEKARHTLNQNGAVKLTALGPVALRAELSAELVKEGFELSKSVVRKPLGSQLAASLADGAFISLKSVGSHVAGASAAEAKRAAHELIAAGRAKLVLRGTEEVMVPPDTPVLSKNELLKFATLAKLVAKAASSKSGASLLQSDLLESLSVVMPGLSASNGARTSRNQAEARAAEARRVSDSPEAAHLTQLLSVVEATRDPSTGLSFVPSIVATLRPELGAETTSAVLLAAAAEGLLELRPEGGIQRLSAEELSVCPPGPQGTRLSWARRTEVTAR